MQVNIRTIRGSYGILKVNITKVAFWKHLMHLAHLTSSFSSRSPRCLSDYRGHNKKALQVFCQHFVCVHKKSGKFYNPQKATFWMVTFLPPKKPPFLRLFFGVAGWHSPFTGENCSPQSMKFRDPQVKPRYLKKMAPQVFTGSTSADSQGKATQTEKKALRELYILWRVHGRMVYLATFAIEKNINNLQMCINILYTDPMGYSIMRASQGFFSGNSDTMFITWFRCQNPRTLGK